MTIAIPSITIPTIGDTLAGHGTLNTSPMRRVVPRDNPRSLRDATRGDAARSRTLANRAARAFKRTGF